MPFEVNVIRRRGRDFRWGGGGLNSYVGSDSNPNPECAYDTKTKNIETQY